MIELGKKSGTPNSAFSPAESLTFTKLNLPPKNNCEKIAVSNRLRVACFRSPAVVFGRPPSLCLCGRSPSLIAHLSGCFWVLAACCFSSSRLAATGPKQFLQGYNQFIILISQ